MLKNRSTLEVNNSVSDLDANIVSVAGDGASADDLGKL